MGNTARKQEERNTAHQTVNALKLPEGMVPLSQANLTVSAPANRLTELSQLLETCAVAVPRSKNINLRLLDDTVKLSSAEGLSDYHVGQWPALSGMSRNNGAVTLILEGQTSNEVIKKIIIEERPKKTTKKKISEERVPGLFPSQSQDTSPSRVSSPYVSENRGESGSYTRRGES